MGSVNYETWDYGGNIFDQEYNNKDYLRLQCVCEYLNVDINSVLRDLNGGYHLQVPESEHENILNLLHDKNLL